MIRLLLIVSSSLVIGAALAILSGVHAKDAGQYGPIDPATKAWFLAQKNSRGVPCCDEADGHGVPDVDWEGTDDKDYPYRVRVNGDWVHVPSEAVLPGPNKFGQAVVWLAPWDQKHVLCFIPGAGS